MTIDSPEELNEEIGRSYEEKPKGWKVLYSLIPDGRFFNFLVVNSKIPVVYQGERETVFSPNSEVVCQELENPREIIRRMPPLRGYGLREMTMKEFMTIVLSDGSVPAEMCKRRIMRREPLPASSIDGPVAMGPSFFSDDVNSLAGISEEQRRLKEELNQKLAKLVSKKVSYLG